MPRLDIKYDISKNLGDKLNNGIGTSKHDDKQKTQLERAKLSNDLKDKGFKGKEYLRELDDINYSSNKIYMDTTFNDYKRICNRFAEFVIEKHGSRRISIDDSKKYIQPYIDKLISDGKSPSYQKKVLSAICKGTNSKMRDYFHETVNYAKQIERKSEHNAIHKEWSEKKYSDLLDLNRCIGIRREELTNLLISNIRFDKENNICLVNCPLSKGGKNNINVIRDPEKIEIIEYYYNRSVKTNNDYLITKDMICKDIDLHSMRAKNAQDEYYRVVKDIKDNPERKDYYINLIGNELNRKNKNYDMSKLNKPYICRGENAKILKELGINTEWDRIGVMYVSLFCLNHYREDTTVQHYLTKK